MMFSLVPQEGKFKFNSSFKLMVSCIFLQTGYKLKFHPFYSWSQGHNGYSSSPWSTNHSRFPSFSVGTLVDWVTCPVGWSRPSAHLPCSCQAMVAAITYSELSQGREVPRDAPVNLLNSRYTLSLPIMKWQSLISMWIRVNYLARTEMSFCLLARGAQVGLTMVTTSSSLVEKPLTHTYAGIHMNRNLLRPKIMGQETWILHVCHWE